MWVPRDHTCSEAIDPWRFQPFGVVPLTHFALPPDCTMRARIVQSCFSKFKTLLGRSPPDHSAGLKFEAWPHVVLTWAGCSWSPEAVLWPGDAVAPRCGSVAIWQPGFGPPLGWRSPRCPNVPGARASRTDSPASSAMHEEALARRRGIPRVHACRTARRRSDTFTIFGVDLLHHLGFQVPLGWEFLQT